MIARASDNGHGTLKRYARQTDAALGGSSVARLPSKQAQTAAVEETARPPLRGGFVPVSAMPPENIVGTTG